MILPGCCGCGLYSAALKLQRAQSLLHVLHSFGGHASAKTRTKFLRERPNMFTLLGALSWSFWDMKPKAQTTLVAKLQQARECSPYLGERYFPNTLPPQARLRRPCRCCFIEFHRGKEQVCVRFPVVNDIHRESCFPLCHMARRRLILFSGICFVSGLC